MDSPVGRRSVPPNEVAAAGDCEVNIICGPYLQNATRHSMTIMWHTDEPGSSVVELERAERLGWSAYVGRPLARLDWNKDGIT